jgi:hypothetical protein
MSRYERGHGSERKFRVKCVGSLGYRWFVGAQIEDAAADLRVLWGLGSGPIADLVRTFELNGGIVIRHDLEAETLDALSGWASPECVPYVVLNADRTSCARSRVNLAHEIGHLILHRNVQPSTLNKKEMFALRIPMMSISHSDLMPIRTERSDAGLSQCEIVIGIRQDFCLFSLT